MILKCQAHRRRIGVLLAGFLLALVSTVPARAQVISNLSQLTRSLDGDRRIYRDVSLDVTVRAASRPQVGVLIVEDDSGVELLELGNLGREFKPGERVRIQGKDCLLRKRASGIELSARPAISNDGTHSATNVSGTVTLMAGLNPVRLDWFNCLRDSALMVQCAESNGMLRSIDSSNFCHGAVNAAGQTNFLPGLTAEGYEGYWETVPDFNLLQSVKAGVVTNFDLSFRTRNEMAGIRFNGYFNAPCAGQYRFDLRSDDGSLLFFGVPGLSVERIGQADVQEAQHGLYGQIMQSLTERRWVEIGGRVGFVTTNGLGVEFELRSDRDVIAVRVLDAAGLDVARLLNAPVRVCGMARGVLTADRRIVLGKIFVASAREIGWSENAPAGERQQPITTVGGVQGLPIEEARRALSVRLRGVVTDARNPSAGRWMSIQDDTRGIFVNMTSVSGNPAFGEYWEVEGHSGAGDFAPVVVADKATFIGEGRVPEPIKPTWNELVNGSQDVQWAELSGLVTAVRSNTVTLMLPEGHLDVRMDGLFESGLKPFERSLVRIRGVLYAIWNAETREVRVGNVMMRNAAISVDTPAPADPFDAVLKTPRELLLFDAQASAFRPVKVCGQIVYADDGQLFLQDGGTGLRLLPAQKVSVQPGDQVETVGYPDIGQTALTLREAKLRKTGVAALPDPRNLAESDWTRNDLDSTRVRLKGELLGWHFEQAAPVLEMQSGTHLYQARLARSVHFSLPVGSELALDGVYVSQGRGQPLESGANAFELLVNSPADIQVLTRPPWWNLERLLILVGVLLVILIFTAMWIKQLRRLVEVRTTQLHQEISERERLEHQHALEAERSRIARDLHDDLGSSLTEISVLASTGQRPETAVNSQSKLFHSIAGKARSLIAALDAIVWAVDPEDNTLQSLADYLASYADDFFSNTTISCRFKVPISFPPITLEGRVRHELLMAVKETLNNVVRHAEATDVEFRMAAADGKLEIEITDNGKGFEGDTDGHGLKNLATRLAKLGGKCAVESNVGGGTVVKIHLLLPAPAKALGGGGEA